MKRITTILSVIVFVGLGCSGCTDWLDIRPESETVLEDYWKTESQATAVLASCYRGLTLDANMARIIGWGEYRSDNVYTGGSLYLDVYKVLIGNITPTNSYADWASVYQVINYCNTFLYYAPGVVKYDQKFTENKLHSLESEALAIRALCYFYLVRAFKDVPLVLNPSISDTQNYYVKKSTEREVLDQILKDLLTAKQYGRESFTQGAHNKGRITLKAINAILADVYLWDQQYENCVLACDDVLADKTLELVSGEKVITDVFYTGNSTESIFELQFDKDVQPNNMVTSLYGNAGTQGQLSFAPYLTKGQDYSPFGYAASAVKESEKDIRETNSYGLSLNGNGYTIYKYAVSQCTTNQNDAVSVVFRSTSSVVNWVMYRLTDVMLMKAEALVQLCNENIPANAKPAERDSITLVNSVLMGMALDYVNVSYMRSNTTADPLSINNYASKNAMEKLVLRERQREFLFEGKRWFDLMRLARRKNDPSVVLSFISPKISGETLTKNKMTVLDALYFPILKSELEANPNLTQNPFYLDTNQ